MGIQVWSGLNSMQSYYSAYEVPKVAPEELSSASSLSEQNLQSAAKEAPAIEDTRSKSTDLSNISLTFLKEDTFDYIGSESRLSDLDIQKAISDMKKDSILQEYQYFVGNQKHLA